METAQPAAPCAAMPAADMAGFINLTWICDA
jgi:hypothetical protein